MSAGYDVNNITIRTPKDFRFLQFVLNIKTTKKLYNIFLYLGSCK